MAASPNVKTLTDANFKAEVLNSEQPTLVDFWATWCAPCRAIAPYVEAIADSQLGKLKVGKMDIDSSPQTPTRYEVRSIPTLLIFHKGTVIGQFVGAASKAKLEGFVKETMAKAGAPQA
jgi:thioredoxin 1